MLSLLTCLLDADCMCSNNKVREILHLDVSIFVSLGLDNATSIGIVVILRDEDNDEEYRLARASLECYARYVSLWKIIAQSGYYISRHTRIFVRFTVRSVRNSIG